MYFLIWYLQQPPFSAVFCSVYNCNLFSVVKLNIYLLTMQKNKKKIQDFWVQDKVPAPGKFTFIFKNFQLISETHTSPKNKNNDDSKIQFNVWKTEGEKMWSFDGFALVRAILGWGHGFKIC